MSFIRSYQLSVKALIRISFCAIILSWIQACRKDPGIRNFISENVVLIVMDGPRYSETWGDSSHQYIPNMYHNMLPDGILFTRFFNNGLTFTIPGHSAMLTGFYEKIENTGNEISDHPSFLQYWRKITGSGTKSAWIFASKDRVEPLKDCNNSRWSGKYNPSTDCGITGFQSGDREDKVTVQHVIDTLSRYHPRMVLVNLQQPDHNGHTGNWDLYTEGIKEADRSVYEIWRFLRSDPFYRGKTSFFVTNDHGRHLDHISTGFMDHGDDCHGCRHISLFAYGPDFKQGFIFENKRELIDIPVTIAYMFGFQMEDAEGNIMTELFERP